MKNNTMDMGEFIRLFEETLNRHGIGICVCALDGRLLYANHVANKYFVQPDAQKNNFVGSPITTLLKSAGDIVPRGLAGDITGRYFASHLDPTLQCWVECSAAHVTDGGEQRIVFVLMNVTDMINCEIKLHESEMLLTSIINTIPDVIYRLDTTGKITYISREVEHYGYDPDLLMGTSILDLVHPNDRPMALYHVNERRGNNRRTLSFELRFMIGNKQGAGSREDAFIPFEVSAEGLYGKDAEGGQIFLGTQGIARDISKRKSAEYELLLNEEKWRTIIESLEDGYYEVDLDGNMKYANKALCDMTESDYTDIIGKNYAEFFDMDVAKEMWKLFNDVYKSGTPAKLTDWVGVSKKKRNKHIEGSISLIKDIEGKVTGFRGIVRDITDRVILEKELLQARKLEAIGILAGGIAHDYNNALTAILGNLSLAKMSIDPQNTELLDILNDAEEASLKVMELTKRLSVFSKGGRPVRKVTTVAGLICDTVNMVLEKHWKDYTVLVPDNLWLVDIDEFQIHQVIHQILNNAMESMPNGGTIMVSAENVKVEREESHHEITLRPDNYVLISISDQGCGIGAENIKNVFDPYFTTKEFGSGMGLAISYAIIKRHHGYIGVTSREDAGTTVYVYLPVAVNS